MSHAAVFSEHRKLLFQIAYRMTGSAADAEDLLQEGFLKFRSVALATVQNSRAFLITLITRICIDFLGSAYERRRTYIGPWLPEPIATGPEEEYIRMESLSTAFLLVLERLTPVERAVFLLRDVFDIDYSEIAQIIEKSEENCRQIASRARQNVASDRKRFEANPETRERLFRAFLSAVRRGDVSTLTRLLAEDAKLISDGGGKVTAARNVVTGADRCIRGLLGVARKMPRDAWPAIIQAGGEPALVLLSGGEIYCVLSLSYSDEKINAVYSVLNPDKLQHFRVPFRSRLISRILRFVRRP